jgi:succinate dehydrogenase flavin-adding protein (antitoxin of CptAB toxin-antitoxin module)
MKELDLLLERFARSQLPYADSEQRRTLCRLLELPDPLLVDYLLGQAVPPEPELADLVLSIRTSPPVMTERAARESPAGTPAELASVPGVVCPATGG